MGQGTSYGYYEEAEGRSDNAHRQPIPASDAHGYWTAAMPNFLELRACELRRIPLLKLSEKGYEQRFERGFRRCGEAKMGRKVPFRCSVRLHCRLFRPFSDGFSTHSGE
jgi:hypothetical protein